MQYLEIELLDLAEETFLSALSNFLVFYEEDNFKVIVKVNSLAGANLLPSIEDLSKEL